jgi:hypothetical protein
MTPKATICLSCSDWETVCHAWTVWQHGRFTMGLPDLQNQIEAACNQAVPFIRRKLIGRFHDDDIPVEATEEGLRHLTSMVYLTFSRGPDHPYLRELHRKMLAQLPAS